jgi:hypothetical protein
MTDKTIEKLYDEILEEEVRLARSVAYSSRRLKPFSVWEVLIPIVFILGYMRTRQQRELFVQNFIFTKKLALQAAKDCCTEEITEERALEHIEEKTLKLLETLEPTIYSKIIRQAQLEEMRLLMQHYLSLLRCRRPVLADCIRRAYADREDYLSFLGQLRKAEQDVAAAAVQTVGDQADPEMVARIDSHTHRLRLKNVDRYYSQTDER